MNFLQVRNSADGTARRVVHFTNFNTPVEANYPAWDFSLTAAGQRLDVLQALALVNARAIFRGAAHYKGKDFGGGIVFASDEPINEIEAKMRRYLSDLGAVQIREVDNLVLSAMNEGALVNVRMGWAESQNYQRALSGTEQYAQLLIKAGRAGTQALNYAVLRHAATEIVKQSTAQLIDLRTYIGA